MDTEDRLAETTQESPADNAEHIKTLHEHGITVC